MVHDDDRGIYGHPDHVAVHRAGRVAARLAGACSYETTVDRDAVRLAGGHLLESAAAGGDYGRSAPEITLGVVATSAELAAKRAAMAAHASQIEPAALDAGRFGVRYAQEWYLRRGARGLLDEVSGGVVGLVA